MKKINCIPVLIILIQTSLTYAQDSLYLVNSLVGEETNRLIKAKATGDLNGDGYADLALIFEDYTYICFGNSGFELNPDFIIPHFKPDPNSIFSLILRVLSFPGDVNNDGYDDLVFLKNSSGNLAVYLGFGGSELDTSGVLLYTQQYTDEVFSGQADPLGDVNGDGYNDFVISSPYNWGNGISYVYLFLGGDSISIEPFVTFMHSPWIDPNSEATFGRVVTGIGDQNKDGYDDFLISDPGYADTVGSISFGRVYLYYGGSEISSSADSILTFPDRKFGSNLKNLGDINNDGLSDYAITSYDSCVIYLSFENKITTRFYGSGHGLGGNGDIDNDKISDFILGYIKGEENDYSGMECYTGSQECDLTPDYYANEEQEYSSFAKYSDFIGDFNGDGYDDIFVVAYTYRKDDKEIGKLYLYSYKNTSGINESKINLLDHFRLDTNYPNPFNNTTCIPFYLSIATDIIIEIYDIQGRKIKTLFKGSKPSGHSTLVWDGRTDSGKNTSSGIYFVNMRQNNNNLKSRSQKIILLK